MARASSKATELARRSTAPTERRKLPFLGSGPGLSLSPRLRAELTAMALFTVAVIIALPLVGLGGAAFLDFIVSGFRALLGRAVWAVPFGLAIIAAEVWRADELEQRYRRLLGGVLLLLAITGLLSLSYDDEPASQAGGLVGGGVGFLLMQMIGEIGTAILLFAVGVMAVLLVSGNDVDTLRWTWRRVRPRRTAESPYATSDAEPPEHPQPAVAERVVTQQYASVDAQSLVPPSAPADIPKKPVINVPAGRDPVKEIQGAVDTLTEALPGESTVDAQWTMPRLDILRRYDVVKPDQPDLEEKARRIEEALASFKVEASVREIFPGPAVTLFALEPGLGVKVARITSLQNDIALALAAPSIRIEAPVPGMARVGIEIPNRTVATVGIREVLESNESQSSKAKIPLPLGRDVNGRYVVADLTRMPHLLIAGATGSGKSICINSIVATFLLSQTPEQLRLVMIDPKMVELVGYKSVPHLQCPIVTEMDKVVSVLRLVLREMEQRYQLFSELGVRNIDGYNMRREAEPNLPNLPYIVVIIDELADLMMTTPEEVETLLARLCQMARATGIHMIIATQRPSVDVLTGLIKANVQARIAFSVASLTDSRVILDMPGAERLLGRGDMLYMPPDAAKPVRIQGSFIDDADLQRIVRHWRKLALKANHEPEWGEIPNDRQAAEDAGDDPLFEQAVQIIRQHGSASASMLQRRLRIGYNRAARLIEDMESEGLIGPADGVRGRTVLIGVDED